MYKSVFEEDAKTDIKEANKWYNKKQKGLGSHFISSVKNRIKQIRENPLSTQIRYNNTHTAIIETFPFFDSLLHQSKRKNNYNSCYFTHF